MTKRSTKLLLSIAAMGLSQTALAQTVGNPYANAQEEAQAVRIYQQQIQYPLAKTYSTREEALADQARPQLRDYQGGTVQIYTNPLPSTQPQTYSAPTVINAGSRSAYNQPQTVRTYNSAGEVIRVTEYPTVTQYTTTATPAQPVISRAAVTTQDGRTVYTVMSGDTIYGISRRYNITPAELSGANGLNSTNLQPGQVLVIPTKVNTAQTYRANTQVTTQPQTTQRITRPIIVQSLNEVSYTVKTGDTLYSIGRRYGVKPSAIMNANNMSGSAIQPGQTLAIPAASGASVMQANTITQPAPIQTRTQYTVVAGDTLYSIGRRYGLKPSAIMNANGMGSSAIQPGQVLLIPVTAVAASAPTIVRNQVISAPNYGAQTTVVRNVTPVPADNVHAVLPGDTLYSVARSTCTDARTLADLNGLSINTVLQPGQYINLPAGYCR